MTEYEQAAKIAEDASKNANTENTPELHRHAAGRHRIAAEHAKLNKVTSDKADNHHEETSDMADTHHNKAWKHENAASAIESCMMGKRDLSTDTEEMKAAKSKYMNTDGTFKKGFDGCVLYMQSEKGGGHSKESAEKICGSIAHNKASGSTAKTDDALVTKRSKLSADDLHFGASAHKNFKEGVNPPGWAVDEDKWHEAKGHILKSTDLDEDKFWPEVVHHYEQLGGTIKGKPVNAKAAITSGASNVEGHSYFTSDGKYESDASDKAAEASDEAQRETMKALGKNDEVAHQAASVAHRKAQALHDDAAKEAQGDQEDENARQAAYDHHDAAMQHGEAAWLHDLMSKNCKDDEENNPDDEGDGIESKSAEKKEAIHASAKTQALVCATPTANLFKQNLATATGIMMYMPAGIHTITPSQGGKAVTVAIEVNQQTAKDLEAQRQLLTAEGKRPFFSIEHQTEIAAFWPSRFFWDRQLDATGKLAEGVWVEGEWSKSGKDAVEGKDFRTFSPTFHVDDVRTDPENPSKVICYDGAAANMGALENDPAFLKLSPLWAKGSNKNRKTTCKNLVREAHDGLVSRGHDPLISDVVYELKEKHNIILSEREAAALLVD